MAASELLALTAELVDLPSESHHERAIADHLQERLERAAPWLAVDRVDDNLVARTDAGRSTRLVLAGHTDTVPVNGNLPSRIEGEVLWGCGAADMKGGLAVMLALALDVPRPAHDLTFVFYACEEVESTFNGLGRLEAERPELLAGDAAILGEPTGGAIEAGCQGTMRVRVELRGERAHTARPWMGRNAVHRLGSLLTRVAGYRERRLVIDGCEFREAVQAVEVEGGIAGNVVPDLATLVLNHRFAPDRGANEAEAHLRALVAPDLEDGDSFAVIDVAAGALPGLAHPILVELIRSNRLEVRAKLGWTDVARFARLGLPAVNFGPGDATLAHTRHERVSRGALEGTYRALRGLVERDRPEAS